MNTMYDTILSLLPFKGLSRARLMDFVSRTPLHFITYHSGERVVEEGKRYDEVRAIVSGHARIIHPLIDHSLQVSFTQSAPSMLNVANLYGMQTQAPVTAYAEGSCGVMEFDKNLLMQLMQREQVVMLNMLNYYAYGKQSVECFLRDIHRYDGVSRLVGLALNVTDTTSTNIVLSSTVGSVTDLLAFGQDDIDRLHELAGKGLFRIHSASKIEIPDRSLLLALK